MQSVSNEVPKSQVQPYLSQNVQDMPPTPAFNPIPLDRNINIPPIEDKMAQSSKDVEMEIKSSNQSNIQIEANRASIQTSSISSTPYIKQMNNYTQEINSYQTNVCTIQFINLDQ